MSSGGSPRILIVRLSAIGDVVHGLPVLNALRAALPQAYLAWVVESRAAELLHNHPALDRVIVVARKWLKSPRAVWRLRRELRRDAFDLTIDLQCLTKSAIAAWLSGARRRIGFAGVDGRELSPWLNNERVEPASTHVIDRNLELLKPLGIERPVVSSYLPEFPADLVRVAPFLSQPRLANGLVLINPGAGWPSKVWPAERYGEVARRLYTSRGLPSVVVWAGAQEKAWAETIVQISAGAALLAPPTTLRELAAVARRSRLCIGSDTGPLHLSAAVGTPCVSMHGPNSGQRTGPYGRRHIALQEILLPGSTRSRRAANNDAMKAISTDQVVRACEQTLAGQTAHGREKAAG